MLLWEYTPTVTEQMTPELDLYQTGFNQPGSSIGLKPFIPDDAGFPALGVTIPGNDFLNGDTLPFSPVAAVGAGGALMRLPRKKDRIWWAMLPQKLKPVKLVLVLPTLPTIPGGDTLAYGKVM